MWGTDKTTAKGLGLIRVVNCAKANIREKLMEDKGHFSMACLCCLVLVPYPNPVINVIFPFLV